MKILKDKFNPYIFFFVFLIFPGSILAAPLETVTNTNDAGPGSLRQAILDVDPGGEIVFNLAGVSPHIISVVSTLQIDKSMTITGPGSNLLILDGSPLATVVITVDDGVPGQSEVVISDLTVDGGLTAVNGIFNRDNLTLNDVIATRARDALVTVGRFAESSMLTINDSLLFGNTQSGIFVFGAIEPGAPGSTVVVNRTTISNNEDFGIINFGTQVESAVSSTVIINKSTISGQPNGIFNDGGNAAGSTGGVVIMRNSTISASSSVGLFNAGPELDGALGPVVMISSSTIADNGAGLIYNSDEIDVLTMEVKNTIIADNAPDCSVPAGGLAAIGENLDADGTCEGFMHPTSAQINLGPLQNNGGPTETHALMVPSVAIDAVTDCTFIDGEPVLEDQRCFLRSDGACDIGAYEYGAQPEPVVRGVPALSTWGAVLTVVLISLVAIFSYRKKVIV